MGSSINNDAVALHESDEDVTEPETDPETVYDIIPGFEPSVATVHWDPSSYEGQMVGYRIRIFDMTREKWKLGRVVRYDAHSNKHKIRFGKNDSTTLRVMDSDDDDDDDERSSKVDDSSVWLRLQEEIIQYGGRFVWAQVKGFAWWPAQVFHSLAPPRPG